MSAPNNFRSAFNGFNREDVVHYIEYLNSKLTSEINQLQSDADLLRAKLKNMAADTDLQDKLTAAEAQRDALQAQLEDALSRNAALAQERDAALAQANTADPSLEERCAELEAQLQAALAAQAKAEADRDAALQNAAKCRMEQELEAYRRAERTERMARERAELVYRQANGALADATVRVDEASSQISQVTDKVSAHLEQLQSAVASSKKALADAAATLYTIRPDCAEE